MNLKLVVAFQSPMTEDNRREILRLISEAAPESSPIVQFVGNVQTVERVVNIAASYVNSATARLSKDNVTWEMLMGTTQITVALQELLKNDSIVNYTQAVMLVTAALLQEGERNGPE